ncbi:hypothetical protein K456DRAFT_546989 [Colletotrichum gloeosporioides 23]|nr:hypothetical protein K456DRAFT_546989 [Colletotrichum gloeosporioides 23]
MRLRWVGANDPIADARPGQLRCRRCGPIIQQITQPIVCIMYVSQTMLFFGSLADCSSPCSAKGKSGNYLFGRAVYAGGIGGGIVLGWGLVPDSVEFPD